MQRLFTKTVLVTFISFLLLFTGMLLLSLFDKDSTADDYSAGLILYAFIIGGFPVMGACFLLLISFNLLLDNYLKKHRTTNRNKIYFVYGCALIILVVGAFFLFDYSDRGRYFGDDGKAVNILMQYLPVAVLGVIVLFLNRKIVWRNFSSLKTNG